MKKLISKKFIVTGIIIILIAVLKFMSILSDIYFTILVAIVYLPFLYVQGKLDLNDIESVKIGDIDIDLSK